MAGVRDPLAIAVPMRHQAARRKTGRTKAVVDRVSVTLFAIIWTIAFFRFAPVFLTGDRWLTVLVAGLGGYLLADLLAGSVHWMADRFFAPETPLLGPMLIAPFRDHHHDALGITRHDFFEVTGNNALVTIPVVVAVAILPVPVGNLAHFIVVFGMSLTLALVATNQFHSWAHSASPPRIVRRLQSWGLILTPKAHARHHRGNHDRAYCVTSGWLNPLIDRTRFFERLERKTSANSKQRGRAT